MKTIKTIKKFDSKSISLKQLEERKEMLIIYGDGRFFPECNR